MEQTLMSPREEEDEHSEEWLKIFSQEAKQATTAVLEAAEVGEEHSVEVLKIFIQGDET